MRFAIGVMFLVAVTAGAQQAAKPAEPVDAVVDVASSYIGRALFLRCFCAENNLTFHAEGKLAAPGKMTDWTLAGFNLQKVERKGPELLQLEGVRVAVKFIPDRREFERHAQNDEKVRITLPDAGDAKRMDEELAKVFAVGIDVALQQSMPAYWRHYFDAKLDWPKDDLTGQSLYGFAGQQLKTSSTVPPSVEHRADSGTTNEAQKDRVRGVVQLRLVVDANGDARRIAVAQPLGYGLDEKAVETMSKFRFHPATDAGKPVPSVVLLQEEYAPLPQPGR